MLDRPLLPLFVTPAWKSNEAYCLADHGSTRRVDILAIDKQEKKAVILDPTVRFEQDIQQVMVLDEEKRVIYLPLE